MEIRTAYVIIVENSIQEYRTVLILLTKQIIKYHKLVIMI